VKNFKLFKTFSTFEEKTNTAKQMISFMAIDLWQEMPCKFQDLNQFAFSKSAKNYVLSQQYQTYVSTNSKVLIKGSLEQPHGMN